MHMMERVQVVLKALADAPRLRALCALRGGERCVCQIVELLALAPSTVSRHMAVLRAAGLVTARKEGRWMHYRLAQFSDGDAVGALVTGLLAALARDPDVRDDARRLRSILREDPREICRRQCAR